MPILASCLFRKMDIKKHSVLKAGCFFMYGMMYLPPIEIIALVQNFVILLCRNRPIKR